jgi:hypothetical protein
MQRVLGWTVGLILLVIGAWVGFWVWLVYSAPASPPEAEVAPISPKRSLPWRTPEIGSLLATWTRKTYSAGRPSVPAEQLAQDGGP